ncbi:MAG: RtcB family protein [Actinobacteria bacterium]|jgi:tRNA-splicing ligase RtcB|nr:MAG: RtcB family protein [Actinomycetota bacterium]
MSLLGSIKKVDDFTWEIPPDAQEGMLVPGVVFGDRALLEKADRDNALQQVINVACLPGIVKASLAMPDIHWGYGFPIGGVAATGAADGVISPGGVGYDISCGVRLIKTSLTHTEAAGRLRETIDLLNVSVPKGLGTKGRLRLERREVERMMSRGAAALVASGIGWEEDLEAMEENGCYAGADPGKVSDKAVARGREQVGTLGSGNHFLEIQVVDEAGPLAEKLGIFEGQVVVMVHSGSRGLGHQVCTDYIEVMGAALPRYGYRLPDRQLVCAPVQSREGRDYLAAMACAANFAMCNREAITHWVRECFERVFGTGARKLGMELLYDVSHNLAKAEVHEVDGKPASLMVHRKGATRAFPGSRPEVAERFAQTGQPVIIPGDMGSYSFVLVGTEEALRKSFGSTCHGAGRAMSRKAAKKLVRGEELRERLESRGIMVRSGHLAGFAEEAPEAYKDVQEVVEICEGAGLSRKVARMRPLAVMKG